MKIDYFAAKFHHDTFYVNVESSIVKNSEQKNCKITRLLSICRPFIYVINLY